MKVLLIFYAMGVGISFVLGVTMWWTCADEGTGSYDYKIAKALVKYAPIFPYAICKVIDLLEEESNSYDA